MASLAGPVPSSRSARSTPRAASRRSAARSSRWCSETRARIPRPGRRRSSACNPTGSWRSSAASPARSALPATQAAARYDLPYIVDVGVSDQITGRGLKNTFRFAPGFGIVTATAVENLTKLNQATGNRAKTVVLVHEDQLFGSGLAKLMQAELPKRGFDILDTIAHPTPARDMSNIALRIRSLNPDLVIPSSYYNEFVLLARTMQQQRIRPKGVYAVLNGARLEL